MKRLLILASFLFLVSAIPLHATGTADPGIGIDDPICVSEGSCQPLVSGTSGTSFFFNADGNGGGITFREVDPNGPTISTLDVETFFTPSSAVNCFSNAFANCSVNQLGAVTDIFFNNSDPLAPGDVFSINLNMNYNTCNPNVTDCSATGTQGWNPDELFTAFPNISQPTTALISTPEPSTIFLLGVGMLGLLSLKRKRFGDFLRSV